MALSSWCDVLGDEDKAPEATEAVGDIMAIVLDPPPPKEAAYKNRDHIDLAVDVRLAALFREAKEQLSTMTEDKS
jgi:hypothetical protein